MDVFFCGPSVPEGLLVSAPFRSTGRTCEKKQPVNTKSICANTLDEVYIHTNWQVFHRIGGSGYGRAVLHIGSVRPRSSRCFEGEAENCPRMQTPPMGID